MSASRITGALIALLFLPGLAGAQSMFRGDPSHSGTYPGQAPRQFHRVKWSFPTGDRIISSPVFQDSVLYFGGDDGNIYAVDTQTGRQIWKRTTGGPVPSTPAVANGTVFVGSYDGDSMRSMRKRGRFDGISKLTENEGLKQKGFMGLNQRIRRSPINMMSFYQAQSLSKAQFILVVVTEIFMRSMSQRAT